MLAAVNTIYGPPDVIELKETPKPRPKDNELLIRVYATTVNRTDCGFLSGKPLIVRPWSGLLKPKNPILGNEFSGVVESMGKTVTKFAPGDKVFGYNDTSFGAHAEYIVIPENGAVALMPLDISFEQAAPMTEGVHYALADLRAAKLEAGQNVLINGATGAIGSAAVQLARHFGATVTAVCATPHIPLVQSLGANTVIDYTRQDFTQTADRFDLVFDAVGKSSFGRCKPLLRKKGIYISTELGYGAQNPFLALVTPLFGGKKLLFPIPSINQEDVQFFKNLAETGQFKPVIDRYYPLEQIAEAYRYVATGMKTGNVVIQVANR